MRLLPTLERRSPDNRRFASSHRVWTWGALAAFILSTSLCPDTHANEKGRDLPLPLADKDFHPINHDAVDLGRFLFYDPILSGNRNISCATCHHPDFATADGVALAIGEGGEGLGPDRNASDPENLPEQKIGRNAPALFNLGAREYRSFFHDGRLEMDDGSKNGFRTPLGDDMLEGFDGLLSAQTMFPVLSPDEMAGHYSENEIARAVRKGDLTGQDGAWNLIARRVNAIDDYRMLFEKAYPDIAAGGPLTFPVVANAIADFIAFEWRSTDSPFDAFMAGDANALTAEQVRGAQLFYGPAGCSNCHSGALQTDHGFHAIAMPQFGPGKTARFESRQHDHGRMRVTGDPTDAYRFRTPSLRNVELTAPYGHTGAYQTLEDIVRHHLDPVASLKSFDRSSFKLPDLDGNGPPDWWALDDPQEVERISGANELEPTTLTDQNVDDLVSFLKALTDQKSAEGRLARPDRVPSGLPFD